MIAEAGSLILREGTQDWRCFQDVFVQNEYRLPERFSRDDVIIDIGANIGTFAAACLVRGAGKVVCFEPEPRNFDVLKRNLAQWGRADCRRMGVWRSDEEGPMRFEDRGQDTATHFMSLTGTIEAPGVGLDSILREFGEVRLVKLDCEGSEYPILFTCTELPRAQEIVGEYHTLAKRVLPWDCTPDGLSRHLGSLGFDVSIAPHDEFGHSVGHFFARRR
jgi:FkbM family methyltransferase